MYVYLDSFNHVRLQILWNVQPCTFIMHCTAIKHSRVVSVLSKKEQYRNDAILFLITHMTCYIHTCLVVTSGEALK